MRVLSVFCGALMLSALAFGQANMVRGPVTYWGCQYGCAPFVPLVTTPMVSLQTVSPSPVGASNATTGLSAGARNSTLDTLPASTDSVYTQPVWYSGADTVAVPPASLAVAVPAGHMMAEHMERMEHHAAEQAVYIAGPLEVPNVMESAGGARTARKAARTYTNDDINRLNQQTGTVKYDGKSEKIQ
ncbi:MAG TPA: hypothetical protein VFI95_23500 [Terriglobales bacterium]|nr:hypothetical protein [Terriglobales bacterium]